jgi:hypothetical protein
MIIQDELDFSASPAKPDISEVEFLLAWLSKNPGFHTAKTIASALDLSDRKIRQLAEMADGLIVSGPGSPGYCHLYHCDPIMIDHSASKLISQGKAMIRRGIRSKRRAHDLIAGRR